MKKIGIILGAIVLTLLSLGGGYRLLVKHIYGSMDCERFNIDHVELRTGIDIPKVVTGDCECDETYRNNIFVLDTSRLVLSTYAQKWGFVEQEGVYYRNGMNNETQWTAELNPETARLKVQLIYP